MLDFDVNEYFLEHDGENFNDMPKLKKLIGMLNEIKDEKDANEMYENIVKFIGYCVVTPVDINTAVWSGDISKPDIKKLAEGKIDKVKSDFNFVMLKNEETKKDYIPVFTDVNEDKISGSNNVYHTVMEMTMLFGYVYDTKEIEGFIINPYTDALVIGREEIEFIAAAADCMNEEEL